MAPSRLLVRPVFRPPVRAVVRVAEERLGAPAAGPEALVAASRHLASRQPRIPGVTVQFRRVLRTGVPCDDGGRGDRLTGLGDVQLAPLLLLRHLRWPWRPRVRLVCAPAITHELRSRFARPWRPGQVRPGAPRHLRLPCPGLPRNRQAVLDHGEGSGGHQRRLWLRGGGRVYRWRLDLVRELGRQPSPPLPRRSSCTAVAGP
mmetsp:Transcript_64990/g.188425  ORF Transcript_64990/g.188425 Transcript_64990/m.188425 type:complete len:203 (-) Transcript_64990:495-1103(-)